MLRTKVFFLLVSFLKYTRHSLIRPATMIAQQEDVTCEDAKLITIHNKVWASVNKPSHIKRYDASNFSQRTHTLLIMLIQPPSYPLDSTLARYITFVTYVSHSILLVLVVQLPPPPHMTASVEGLLTY